MKKQLFLSLSLLVSANALFGFDESAQAASSSSSSAQTTKKRREIATLLEVCEKKITSTNVDYHALPGALKHPFYKKEINKALLNRIGWQSPFSIIGYRNYAEPRVNDHYGNRHVVLASNNLLIQDIDSGATLHTLEGHTAPINSAQFNHDGTRIISASDDRTVRIWDANTGMCRQTLKGYRGPVLAACFNHDGTEITSISGTAPFYAVTFWSNYLSILNELPHEIIELCYAALPAWEQNQPFHIDQEVIDQHQDEPTKLLLNTKQLFTTQPIAASSSSSKKNDENWEPTSIFDVACTIS